MRNAFLRDEARCILQQRMHEAAQARLVKRVRALGRTRRQLQRTISAGLHSGLAMHELVSELIGVHRAQGLAKTEAGARMVPTRLQG